MLLLEQRRSILHCQLSEVQVVHDKPGLGKACAPVDTQTQLEQPAAAQQQPGNEDGLELSRRGHWQLQTSGLRLEAVLRRIRGEDDKRLQVNSYQIAQVLAVEPVAKHSRRQWLCCQQCSPTVDAVSANLKFKKGFALALRTSSAQSAWCTGVGE